jgi:hypothetical protein
MVATPLGSVGMSCDLGAAAMSAPTRCTVSMIATRAVSVRAQRFSNLNDWANSLLLAALCRGLAFPPSALPLALRCSGAQ